MNRAHSRAVWGIISRDGRVDLERRRLEREGGKVVRVVKMAGFTDIAQRIAGQGGFFGPFWLTRRDAAAHAAPWEKVAKVRAFCVCGACIKAPVQSEAGRGSE